jgi:hypothetical protein
LISFAAHKKAVDALSRALKPLSGEQVLPLGDLADALEEASKACAQLDLESMTKDLKEEAEGARLRREKALASRREDLLKTARDQEYPHKRFSDYDYIGPFKISYKGRTVLLELGSERFESLSEANGAILFELIRERANGLDREAVPREVFFQTLKDALRLAKAMGHAEDGRVAVRALYPFLVLARHGRSETFLNKPDGRTFKDYPLTQFLYDLARFGRDGWRCGDELLRTQTPNMATISQGKTLMLPNLDAQEGTSHRIAVLWIEKREG